MSVVVFGSINMDLVVRTPRLPGPGETIIGRTFKTFPGGKGANQAVACARLGADTRMVGRVGGDSFGNVLLDGLDAAGVDHSWVTIDPPVSSGVALIAVDDAAENNIIVVSGANGQIDETDLIGLEQAIIGAKVLLLQLEIPLPIVVKAAHLAQRQGLTVILDPAPARPLPNALYRQIDILTPNEVEASTLLGYPVDTEERAVQAAEDLLGRGVGRVLIKMGERGVYAASAGHTAFYPPFRVQAVDTVAAGDAFNGALAVALSEGLPFDEALRWGAAGGALAVTQPGAQPAMPGRHALLALLASEKAGKT